MENMTSENYARDFQDIDNVHLMLPQFQKQDMIS